VMRRAVVAVVLVILAAGCASDEGSQSDGQSATGFPEGSFALIASSDVGTGPSRLLVGVTQEDGTRIGSPDDPVQIEVAPLDESAEPRQVPGTFMWLAEGLYGLYRAEVDFDTPGPWSVTVRPSNGEPLPPTQLTVQDETSAPNIGERAPVAPTPTLDDAPIEDLTTDPDPDPRFYQTTLDEALSSGKPTVLVFATPAYCTSATCGPMLDTVKEAATAYPDVNFIHIEVYQGFNEAEFAPDPAHLAPAVGSEYWNLPSEPWVFVMDGDGFVTGRFEGVLAPDELVALLS
jgi:hypothetical protein